MEKWETFAVVGVFGLVIIVLVLALLELSKNNNGQPQIIYMQQQADPPQSTGASSNSAYKPPYPVVGAGTPTVKPLPNFAAFNSFNYPGTSAALY